MKILRSLLLLSILVCPALAWNSPGHKVIALIASSELSDEVNAQIVEILRHHPFPEARELLGASVWPDRIKEYPEYAHGTWHYANAPLFLDGKVHPTQDHGLVVQALQQNIEVLRSDSATKAEKAVALAWVIHLVGDVHQPLHAATSYTSEMPEGDRGGNEYHIRYLEEETNLHSFWDSAGGLFWKGNNGHDLEQVASHLGSLYTVDGMLAVTDPEVWKHESHVLARYVAYPESQPDHAVSESYVGLSRGISEKRLALAGHRLAMVLRQIFAAE